MLSSHNSPLSSVGWENVDLKVLLNVLSLADPPITQAKVAQMLKVSPVTLSKLVHSTDHRIREEWVNTLCECLDTINFNTIQTTITALIHIQSQLAEQKWVKSIIPVLEEYFDANYPDKYQFDSNYWGISNGIIRFYNKTENIQWLFSRGSEQDGDRWRLSRRGIGPFNPFVSIKSFSSNDRASIFYEDIDSFSSSVKMANYRYDNAHFFNVPLNQFPFYKSLFLYNPQSGQIEEEYVLPDNAHEA